MKKIPFPVFYFASYAVAPLLGLLQTKFFATHLSVDRFAQIQLILPLMGWVLIIGGLGAPQYILRFYERDRDEGFWKGMVFSSLVLSGVFVFASLILMVLSPRYPPISHSTLFLIYIWVLILNTFSLIKALRRAEQNHGIYNANIIVERVLNVAGAVLGIYVLRSDPLVGYLCGTILGTGSIVVFNMVKLSGTGGFRICWLPWDEARKLLIYGFPIISVLLLSDMLGNVNRYVIAHHLDSSHVTSFVICTMISNLSLQAIYEPVLTYIQPMIFRAWHNNNKGTAEAIISRYVRLYLALGTLVALICIQFEPLLIEIVANDRYVLPRNCFAFMMAASLLVGLYRFLVTHYLLRENTVELVLCFVASLLVTVGGAVILVDVHGLLGVSMAVFAGSAVLCAMVWVRGRGILRIQFNPFRTV